MRPFPPSWSTGWSQSRTRTSPRTSTTARTSAMSRRLPWLRGFGESAVRLGYEGCGAAHSDVLAAGLTLLPWSVAMAQSSWAAGAWLVS